MIPLSDLRLMLVKVSPVGVSGDKIMAELQKAERLDMLEGCGEMPLRPPSVRGFLLCGSRMSVPGQRTNPLSREDAAARSGVLHLPQ